MHAASPTKRTEHTASAHGRGLSTRPGRTEARGAHRPDGLSALPRERQDRPTGRSDRTTRLNGERMDPSDPDGRADGSPTGTALPKIERTSAAQGAALVHSDRRQLALPLAPSPSGATRPGRTPPPQGTPGERRSRVCTLVAGAHKAHPVSDRVGSAPTRPGRTPATARHPRRATASDALPLTPAHAAIARDICSSCAGAPSTLMP